MLKKDNFQWTQKQTTAFQNLKETMISAPVLALPNFSEPFTLETDASGTGLGAVMMQQGRPIAYYSSTLCPKNAALSTYEKEYMAILLAVEQWRAYLQHVEFLILTDHCSLAHLEDQG